MGQKITWDVLGAKRVKEADNLVVVVPAPGNTELLKLPIYGQMRLFVQISVAGTKLDAFIVNAKAHADAPFVTVLDSFAGTNGIVIASSGDLTKQHIGDGWLALDIRSFVEVQILASAFSTSATVSIWASAL